jgi:hypothetical protein
MVEGLTEGRDKKGAIFMLPHVEPANVAAFVDKLLAVLSN